MTETDLFGESLRLLVIGMGIVYAFLLLLVVLLRAMSAILARFAPAPPDTAPSAAGAQPIAAADADVVAVIAAAIARYRAGRGPH